jgi:ketosteroid isomerase-like protein
MTDEPVLAAERAFFAALLAGEAAVLDGLLADDFVIVDVMAGQAVSRQDFLGAIASGDSAQRLEFVEVVRNEAETLVRHRPGVAVVLGRTRMTMRFQGQELTVPSRYTHVWSSEDGDRWRLFAAQGTPEAPRTRES